jgi:ABC-2 type transport system permease protein
MSSISKTNTQTFLQKLLGRQYKWWYIIKQGFNSNTIYRYNSFTWLLSSVVLILGTLIIWYINYSQSGVLSPDFREIFTYFVIGEAFIFASAIQFDIGESIQKGKFTNRLMMPTSYLKYYCFYQFGYQLFENLSKLIIYLILALIMNQFLILPSLINFISFIIAIIIAYFLNLLFGIIIGGMAFFLTAFHGTAALFDSLKLVLGGRLFPFNKLNILKPFALTPFAFTFYHPMQVYLGKYDLNQTFLVLLSGTGWCFVLYFLAKFVFKLGLKRNEAVGL